MFADLSASWQVFCYLMLLGVLPQAGTPPNKPAVTPAAMSGVVLDGTTRQPVAGAVVSLWGVPSESAVSTNRQGAQPAIAVLLDAYRRGEYDLAIRSATAAGPTSAGDFYQTLQRDAPAWIASGADRGRRHLIVGSFYLETIKAFHDQVPRIEAMDQRVIDLRMQLNSVLRRTVEWACELVKAGRSLADREWFLASVELLRNECPEFGLLYGASSWRLRDTWYPNPEGHLAHAVDRFPGESQFRFVDALKPSVFAPIDVVYLQMRYFRKAIGHEEAKRALAEAPAIRARQKTNSAPGSGGIGLGPYRTLQIADRVVTLQNAARALTPLRNDPEIQVDVRLLLGAIALTLDDNDEARRQFDGIPLTSRAAVVYVAQFLRGCVDERDGRPGDAERDYRLALDAVPGAHAASTALASLLWTNDRQAEAASIVGPLTPPGPTEDPWASQLGIGRWSERITALRRQAGTDVALR